ncbi:uncharacterized protein LOC106172357 [Lingula anatina]|uniref:Uncharacterized protein LOC106172357 n=1 Tax=Lingula anatina TaxID=7574 RepID=A0A1S3JDQ9_LINAN|nr:uncharacterized protein LOC106172357 [Lingula anatina]|eukprot:XP_013408468.1 uncharacterized protein LOC106172357 [Lingula anatina]
MDTDTVWKVFLLAVRCAVTISNSFALPLDQSTPSTSEMEEYSGEENNQNSNADMMLNDGAVPSLAQVFRNSFTSYPTGIHTKVVYTTSIHHRIKMQVKRRIFRHSQILYAALKVYKYGSRPSERRMFPRQARVSLYLIKDKAVMPLDSRLVNIHTSEWLQFDATEAVSLFVHQPHLFKGLEVRVNSIRPGVHAARAARQVHLVTDEKHNRKRHRPFFVVYFSHKKGNN